MDDMDEPYRPTVHTQADLETVWRHLMQPLGFSGHSLWILRIDPERRVVPRLTEVADCEEVPEPDELGGLSALLRMLEDDAPGGSIALLRSRPGHGIDDADRAWARRLGEAGRSAGVRLEMTHLATDADVVPLPPDELVQRTA